MQMKKANFKIRLFGIVQKQRRKQRKQKMNNTYKEIAQVLEGAQTILLYPHVSADGDALGSCAALCRALRMKGKEAFILVEEELPLNLAFWIKDIARKIRISLKMLTFHSAWTAGMQCVFRDARRNLRKGRQVCASTIITRQRNFATTIMWIRMRRRRASLCLTC